MSKQQTLVEDEDYEDGVWVPNDNSLDAVEAMEAVADFFRVQHQNALELTKLTLEYSKSDNLTKEKIFGIFQDAMSLMQKNMNRFIK